MRILLALLGSLMASAAQAALPASWLELDYVNTDIDVADGDGYLLSGRWLFGEHWFVAGRYGESDLDLGSPRPGQSGQADWEYLRVGVGYRAEIHPQLEWFGLLSYDRVDLSVIEDEAETGENFETGLLYNLAEGFNVGGSIEYEQNNTEQETDLFDGDFGFVLRSTYQFSERFGLGLTYEKIDTFDEWRAGVILGF